MLGVVFVHGINSSARAWDGFGGLIARDGQLAGVVAEPVVRFGYATGMFPARWRLRVVPSVTTAADSLKEYLATEAGGFERVVLVGHSQGGLVIQRCLARMLSEGRGLELARIRRVVLLATPNTGSQLLLSTRRMLVRGNPQERGLRPFDELVVDTLRIVLRDIVNAPSAPTERTCRIPFSVYAAEQDGVVTPASARAVFPDAAALPGDHFTIAKPDTDQHRTYTTVRRLLLQAATDGDRDLAADTAASLGPSGLEVHYAYAAETEGADQPTTLAPSPPGLTAYLPRPHDPQLRTALSAVLAGGASRLVTLTGESSTGKTRALYQALVELAPHTPLLHPVDADDLLALLHNDRVQPGCVLWLNEAQRFFYREAGEKAAARLRGLLNRTTGIAVLATLWTKPYWDELTAPARPGDPHAQARALLTHPGFAARIDVPAQLTVDELDAWRRLAADHGDARLSHALCAGEGDGRVVQHLSGGPELLAAYLAGPGALFTPREHALITAALDARHLGHRAPLPGALLAEAAEGYLTDRHRSPDTDWAAPTLLALTGGRRADGTRTDIRATLTALIALYPYAGAPPVYEPADYLDQHTRRSRPDQDGSTALWRALITHTADREDQAWLGTVAWDRGLRTTAARLWTRAVAAGHSTPSLARLGPTLDPGGQAAMFSAIHAELTEPFAVAILLGALQEAGAGQEAALLERSPAAQVELTEPRDLAILLLALGCGRGQKGATPLERSEAATLLKRSPAARDELNDHRVFSSLVRLLVETAQVGQERATLLEARAFDSRSRNAKRQPSSFGPYGCEPDGQPSPPWTWHTLTQNPGPRPHT